MSEKGIVNHVYTDSNGNAWHIAERDEAGEKRIRVFYIPHDSNGHIVMIDRKLPPADVQDPNYAAQALRAIPSDKRSQASRENGKKGGRPKKVK